jgi:hypothetical protein
MIKAGRVLYDQRGCIISNVPAALAAENIKKNAFLPIFDSAPKAAGTYDTPSLEEPFQR